jgi:hypothetical protein
MSEEAQARFGAAAMTLVKELEDVAEEEEEEVADTTMTAKMTLVPPTPMATNCRTATIVRCC